MKFNKTATFDLYLHGGHAPHWLVKRMKLLGKVIITFIVEEFGQRELLRRIADPLWFQAFSYVLGYDWDSSGVTTVTTGVLREILTPETGILAAGGKGKRSLNTPQEIKQIGKIFDFDEEYTNYLIQTSRKIAKIDNAVIQDEHNIYHHTIFISEDKHWSVIQQGMNPKRKTARRYHWISEGIKSFVEDPHKGILGSIKLPFVLNMASKESCEAQKVSVDLVNDGISVLKRDLSILEARSKGMKTLETFLTGANYVIESNLNIRIKIRKINWKALEEAYKISPGSYEELIGIKGIGPGTIRALALVAELIYNAKVCWKDPIRYTFAVGGKDGVPYPVNVRRMEEVADILRLALESIKLDKKEKVRALKKLSYLLPT